MNPLSALVRSLGNDRALANARSMIDARRQEDWAVQRLERRLPGSHATVDGAREVDAA